MFQAGNKLYTAAQVRQLDRAAIEEHGIPAYELMCRAGRAVTDAAIAIWPHRRHWLVLCGAGNNGGDGYVLARLAREQGIKVTLVALKPPGELSGEAATAATDWQQAGGEVHSWPYSLAGDEDLLLDALLGTGLDREVGGAWLEAVELANGLDCPRVAVDIPSGLQADSGRVLGAAIRADLTVSFIGRKQGLHTADGPDHSGKILFDRLGTPDAIHDSVGQAGTLLDEALLNTHLRRRARNSHKGLYGHVLVIGGNAGMSGAALLAGEAALRSGAGLVTVGTHPVHAHWLNLSRPELMVTAAAAPGDIENALQRADVVALGPGLGTDSWAGSLLKHCMTTPRPIVVDADGLNLLAGRSVTRDNWILTPHPAEAARLLAVTSAEVQADRVAAAKQLAHQHQGVAVLKGCGTVIAAPDGRWSICGLGNPGMATAGAGDVLTGVTAAMLAQGFEPYLAAQLAVTAHAAAGDSAAGRGERGLLATDISDCLPTVINGVMDD